MRDRPKAPSGAWLTRQLRRAEKHAATVEPLLAAAVEEVLTAIGDDAARRFTARATALTAAATPGVTSSSTMVCLKPPPEQQAALHLGDVAGTPVDVANIHLTLCYLGDTIGPLGPVADALRPVALTHAALSGLVGGYGAFADRGDGCPLVALPDVPGLVELRVAVTQALAAAGIDYARSHGYCPHLTLGYFPTVPALDGLEPRSITFGSLYIVRGDTEVVPLPLAGRPPVTASADEAIAWGPSPVDEAIWKRMQELRAAGRTPLPAEHVYDALLPDFDHAGGGRRFRVKVHADRTWSRVFSAVAASPEGDVVEQIREVAEAHQPAEPSYGHVAWNAATRTVYWQDWDGTSVEEHDAAVAAFLAIDGVDHVEAAAEAALPDGDGWEQVYSTVRWPLHPELYQRFAAGDPPPFIPPGSDEIVDADEIVGRITARIKPVRDAAIEAATLPMLGAVGLSFDVTNPLIDAVMQQTGSQVVDIAHTTRLNVMRIVRASYEEGLSIPHTAAAIREGMAAASPARATLIARTELAGAVNGASLAAVRIVGDATGVTHHKVWMTAPGAQYPRHNDYDGLDGQTRGLTEEFDVGGAAMQHPADPNGPPEEVCNCRCALRYDDGSAPDE